jgi:hypothetical protein
LNRNDTVERVVGSPIAEKIELPMGKKLVTFRIAALYITKLSKAEYDSRSVARCDGSVDVSRCSRG